jgi:hypothetical protein
MQTIAAAAIETVGTVVCETTFPYPRPATIMALALDVASYSGSDEIPSMDMAVARLVRSSGCSARLASDLVSRIYEVVS